MSGRRPSPKLLLPLAILGVGVVGVLLLVATREAPETRKPPAVAPLVRVVEAHPQDWQYVVLTQGTVAPRTQSDLIAQVSGEVTWISPNLVSGGFFGKGDPLVRIDRDDYEVGLQTARAVVARTQSEFDRAQTERERQRKLEAEGVASQARIDDAENSYRVAEASLAEARARLVRAERDLVRTKLRAPYQGRVRSENVDVGQVANSGQRIATLYAVDWAEVRLPIPDRELRYVDVPLGARTRNEDALELVGPEVRLHTEFAGRAHTWTGRVVRTEGEIDPKSRMVNLVARVEDPYGVHEASDRPPLAVGLFVEAEILGETVSGVFVLPRTALRPGDPMDPDAPDAVHVIDAEERLRIRTVEVLRSEPQRVVIGAGLTPGERVSISPLPGVVDGMSVRVAAEGKSS
jgi:RND family efflux transporter MFP subunit